ncbi:hypothetical protein L7E55_06120 [Pelotomaculum isophthalicicum JI]|uniref:Uncharacterized protein n=1 Tax=Pelotomaculum isophthalicicum JI TaxID=947010 RepID=A0A9X4H4W0_9FIRM|nr:hypothetical protein [Pelotomaculum isophthalicicum]MDF9407937.1 hypothetical protein [Pelotomaculum isophthalicicum JI]
MAFEVYKPRGERAEKLPLVSLSKNSLVMNNKAREKLNKPEIVELAYDKSSNTIRIKSSKDGLNVKKTKVFAKGFFNYFDINKKGRFAAVYDENESALYVNIDNTNLQ